MIPYIQLSVSLHSCIADPEEFAGWLEERLIETLGPESDTDIEVEITESAGWL